MKPTIEKRIGLVKAAVFERKYEGKNGGEFVSKSIALQQSYLKDGLWHNNSLTIAEKNLRNTINALEQVAQELGC